MYKSEEEVIKDVLKLSSTITYKFAVSNCNIGGGKVVIMVDSLDEKGEALYRSLRHHIESLNGKFFIGENVCTLDLLRV